MGSDRLVINASPLIFLAGIGGLEWVAGLAEGPVLVPRAVAHEVAAGEGGAEIVDQIEQDARFSIVSDMAVPDVLTAWDLGAGETQALAYGFQQPAPVVILDDKAARQCARAPGVRIVGTLGVVLVARRRGWIAHARPIIERLQSRGMFLSADLISAALRDVGE